MQSRPAPRDPKEVPHTAAGSLRRGVVHVHHHRQCSEDLPVSDDPATAAFLKTTCGPDAYEVKLLGPEVIVARPRRGLARHVALLTSRVPAGEGVFVVWPCDPKIF